ncbi:hypothetical protein [Pararhizobium qamdonense]|uniref:hypothetical protein n=1 Tax=Pararhizobium qamdonense TaxID=3031126 RepID=UPI0023E09EBB|nr:hypothetical protein [Pararhizobium qamdonense]
MTVSSEVSCSGPYTGNGVTTVFPYEFKITSAAHMRAFVTDALDVTTELLLGDGDFSVSGVGEESGGNVTTSQPVAGGNVLWLSRDVPFTQETALGNQGAYFAETVERAFDLATMRDQQLAEKLSRAILTPIGVAPPVFPPAEDGSLLGWGTAGQLENKSISLLTDAVADAEAARDDIAGIVASIAVITEHPPFTVFLGQSSVTIPGGYDVVAYVFLNSLRFYAWSAPDGLTITFPPLTTADTDGAASVEMVIGTGFNSVFAFDTVDGGAF